MNVFAYRPAGGGRVGPQLTRPSPSEYFDLVSEYYADVAFFFSRVCTARAACLEFRVFRIFFFFPPFLLTFRATFGTLTETLFRRSSRRD